MTQVTIVTEDNISQIVERIRQLLLGREYTVVSTRVDRWSDSGTNVYTQSGHKIKNAHHVRETRLEGKTVILIDDNQATYFIPLHSQIFSDKDGFRVVLPKGSSRSSKKWAFELEAQDNE